MTENARGRESAQILVFSGSLLKREKEGKPNVRICKKSGNFEQSENTAKAGYTKCLPWERRQVFFSKAFKATTKTLKLQQNSNKTTRTSLQQLKHSRKSSGNFFSQDHRISLSFPVRFRCHSPRRDWTWKRVCLAVGDGKRRIRRKEKKTKTKSERENM